MIGHWRMVLEGMAAEPWRAGRTTGAAGAAGGDERLLGEWARGELTGGTRYRGADRRAGAVGLTPWRWCARVRS